MSKGVQAKHVPLDRLIEFKKRPRNLRSNGSNTDEIRAWFPDFPVKVVRVRLRKLYAGRSYPHVSS